MLIDHEKTVLYFITFFFFALLKLNPGYSNEHVYTIKISVTCVDAYHFYAECFD